MLLLLILIVVSIYGHHLFIQDHRAYKNEIIRLELERIKKYKDRQEENRLRKYRHVKIFITKEREVLEVLDVPGGVKNAGH